MAAIIRDVIFPIMRYSDADEELWDSDPIEYIRTKFGKCFFVLLHVTSRPIHMDHSN